MEAMEAYGGLALVYDTFMDETPYEEWSELLSGLIGKYGVSKPVRDSQDILESERNLVVDLGCGTGTLSELLYKKGFDVIGVDCSQEMLEAAMEKKALSGAEILYLHQDMRELELFSTVGTVVSVCDSVNYILKEEELVEVFSLVNNYLYPGGVFIFDFNTVYKYEMVIGDRVIAENRENCSFIWENFYDRENQVNEYDVTVFLQEEGALFRRFQETHLQKGYTCEQMVKMVECAGLQVLTLLDADTGGEVRTDSERVYVVAKECLKKENSSQDTTF